MNIITLLHSSHHSHHGTEIRHSLCTLLAWLAWLASWLAWLCSSSLCSSHHIHSLLHDFWVSHTLQHGWVTQCLLQLRVIPNHLTQHRVRRYDIIQHLRVLQHIIQHLSKHRILHHTLHHLWVHSCHSSSLSSSSGTLPKMP